MLSRGKLTAAQGFDYLLRGVAHGAEDYYARDEQVGEAPGRWVASSGALLGLTDEVTDEAFRSVYGEHADPRTGETLGRTRRVYRSVTERLAEAREQLEASAGREGREVSPEEWVAAERRIRRTDRYCRGRQRMSPAVALLDGGPVGLCSASGTAPARADPLPGFGSPQGTDPVHMAARAAWALLAPLIAGQPRMRVSRDRRSYPQRWGAALCAEPPGLPAAARLYGRDGTARCLAADLDVSRGGADQVAADATALEQLVARCGWRSVTDRTQENPWRLVNDKAKVLKGLLDSAVRNFARERGLRRDAVKLPWVQGAVLLHSPTVRFEIASEDATSAYGLLGSAGLPSIRTLLTAVARNKDDAMTANQHQGARHDARPDRHDPTAQAPCRAVSARAQRVRRRPRLPGFPSVRPAASSPLAV